MSENVEVDESGVTWKSENDIVRDLALLNEFGSPGDTEPYKVLYSVGRGMKIKDRQENPQTFVDSRTGEVINLKDVEFEVNGNSKKSLGRGRLLGNFSSTNSLLQEQLRLARPLGSGDEAIESYCRRNRGSSTNTSDSDPDSQSRGVASKSSGCAATDSDIHRPRIIGTRNSMLQSNALIDNLLCKVKDNCNAEFMHNMIGDTEDDVSSKNFNDDSSGSCDNANLKSSGHSLRWSTNSDRELGSSNVPFSIGSDIEFPALKSSIKDTLEDDGSLRKFKAEMRTKIMDILNGQVAVEKPHLSSEILLLNELIREYLTWSGYKYAKSVFVQESGLSNEPLPRSQLLEDLGVCDTQESSKFSILHGIVAAFKEDIKKGGPNLEKEYISSFRE